MGTISGAETAYPSGAPDYTPGFCGVRVDRSLVFSVVFLLIVVCPFVHFHLAIMLSVLRFTDLHYPFGIFKLFLQIKKQVLLCVCSISFHSNVS